jgi:hypothetical protein
VTNLERLALGAFGFLAWPVILVCWLDDHVEWTLGLGWGALIVFVLLIVRGAL